jgi:hypothetical protein
MRWRGYAHAGDRRGRLRGRRIGSASQTRARTGTGRAGSEPCIAWGYGGRAEHGRARRGCTRGKPREDQGAAMSIARCTEGLGWATAPRPHSGRVWGWESRRAGEGHERASRAGCAEPRACGPLATHRAAAPGAVSGVALSRRPRAVHRVASSGRGAPATTRKPHRAELGTPRARVGLRARRGRGGACTTTKHVYETVNFQFLRRL